MSDLKVVDNDIDTVSVIDEFTDKEVRSWSYASDTERRTKMMYAREFVQGYFQARSEEPMKTVLAVQEGYQNPITQVAFRAGFIFCREYMARFVEQGGDAVTANSIRLNWLPQFDADPGKPRKYDFAEIAEADDMEAGPWRTKNPGPSVDGAVYALTVMTSLGMDVPA